MSHTEGTEMSREQGSETPCEQAWDKRLWVYRGVSFRLIVAASSCQTSASSRTMTTVSPKRAVRILIPSASANRRTSSRTSRAISSSGTTRAHCCSDRAVDHISIASCSDGTAIPPRCTVRPRRAMGALTQEQGFGAGPGPSSGQVSVRGGGGQRLVQVRRTLRRLAGSRSGTRLRSVRGAARPPRGCRWLEV